MKFLKYLPLIFLALFVVIAFRPFIFQNKLPIPADSLVGLYHPWRDAFAKTNPNGIPFRNFLITDPVRQQYPWRQLAVSELKRGVWPVWNPYQLSGTPLLGNLQTAALSPLNVLYFLGLPFSFVWSFQILLQVVLGGLFMWLYLKSLKLHSFAITLGVLSWVGSGFFIGWLEWNTLVQVAMWLPLLLLLIDKIFFDKKNLILNSSFLILALAASFLSGHLQIFSYVAAFGGAYVAARFIETRKIKPLLIILISGLAAAVISAPQWFPMLEFLSEASRSINSDSFREPGWFLPVSHLAQFVAPDFFGNPATLNYFGTWNYLELVGYIGLVGLTFALFALFGRRDKKTLFFGLVTLGCLIFALPTPLAKLPFLINIPLISAAQPTRLMVLIDFSLAVLAALGLDAFLKSQSKKPAIIVLAFVGLVFFFLWGSALRADWVISERNLLLPTLMFGVVISLIVISLFFKKFQPIFIGILLLLALFDTTRFFGKFEAFSDPALIFPNTKALEFLQKQPGVFRVATLDDRLLPPNTTVAYNIQTIDGYDSLFLTNYLAYINRFEPNSNWNRILIPKNYQSPMFNDLGVKYVLSLTELNSPSHHLVFKEGQTKIYENTSPNLKPRVTLSQGTAKILSYQETAIVIETQTSSKTATLILWDPAYPSWQATIDTAPTPIRLTQGLFREIIVPEGKHTVRFFIN